jgi:DNA repair exonuclease SbcCD ATPase subunit
MRLKSLVINNLYSFGDGVQIVFNDIYKTLILGVNNDESGADSNGAGKSNILNVIFWVLLGEVFQKENAFDVIRRGKKKGSATLTLTNGDIDLVIERGRSKSTKYLKVRYGYKDITCDTDMETQKELLKVLNISPRLKAMEIANDFINTCYFSSDTVKGFMAKEVKSKQRFEIIERYLGLNRYSIASEEAKKKKKDILDKISPVLEDIIYKEDYLKQNTILGYEEQIKANEEERNKITEEIKILQQNILNNSNKDSLEKIISEKDNFLNHKRQSVIANLDNIEREINTNNQNIKTKEHEKVKYDLLNKKVIELEKQYDKNKKVQKDLEQEQLTVADKINKLYSESSSLNSDLTTISTQITNPFVCPKCSSTLMIQNNILTEVDIEKLKSNYSEKKSKQVEISRTINSQNQRQKELRTELTNINNETTEYISSKRQLDSIHAEEFQNDILSLKNKNVELVNKYNNLSYEAQTEVSNLKQELEQLKKQLKSLGDFNTKEAEEKINNLSKSSEQITLNIGHYQSSINKIKEVEEEVNNLKKSVATKKKEAEVFGFWELGFKQIKMTIIDNFLPDFEDKVNEYLSRLKVNMRVDFDTQKLKSNITKKDLEEGRGYKEEFNVTVYRDDALLPFNLLSKGQRSRVGSCVGMALRELTKERGNNIFDFFFMDEIADSLDESGLRELNFLLDEVPGQKLIISHNDRLKTVIEDTITVEMNNGVSTITYE